MLRFLALKLAFFYTSRRSLICEKKKKIFLMRRLSLVFNGAGPKLIQTLNAVQLTPFSWREKKVHLHF